MPVRPLPYRLELTADELRSLYWLEARGYAGKLIECATVQTDDPATGITVLQYTESDAWAAAGAYDDESDTDDGEDPDYGTCAGGELLRKMLEFREGII